MEHAGRSVEQFMQAVMRITGKDPCELNEADDEAVERVEPRGGDGAQLPLWKDPERAAPSAVLRSALFGVGRRGLRKHLDDEKLASWKGTTIRYKGDRLDQYDEDVWFQALHLHRLQNLADHQGVRFTDRRFLKSLGRACSGQAAGRLHKSLLRMTACAVIIKVGGKEYFGNLLNGARDEETGRYCIKLNPDLKKLFDVGFTKIEWKTRRELRTDLARWLHGYVQSHRATKQHPHRIGVRRLRELCGSVHGLKGFRCQLRRAMAQLEAKGVVVSWRITDNDALEVVRPIKRKSLPTKK